MPSIELECDVELLDANAPRRRLREFLPLLARLIGRALVLGRAVARIHVALDLLVVRLDVVDDLVFHRPPKEVELPDRGLYVVRRVFRYGYSIPSTEGVEALLRIRLKVKLVVDVDFYAPTVVERDDSVVRLGVVGRKPVDDAERDERFAVDDTEHFGEFVDILIIVA